jgi:hypothetical protein
MDQHDAKLIEKAALIMLKAVRDEHFASAPVDSAFKNLLRADSNRLQKARELLESTHTAWKDAKGQKGRETTGGEL